MKLPFLPALTVLFLLGSGPALYSAEPNATPADANKAEPAQSEAEADLEQLVEKIQAKLEGNKRTEQDLAEEIKQFDVLLAKHKERKTDDVAQILLMKAMLYLQVLENPKQGLTLVQQLKKDFPDTTQAKNADDIIASIEHMIEAKKIQETLVVGASFPDFTGKDLASQPQSIAQYKGKVLLIDFWATWCGPCIRELPNVLDTYEKYHGQGFEIIGISLDKDEEALTGFIKKRNMAWPQIFDGQGWESKLAAKYGVTSIPATFLLDGQGKILARDLRGKALGEAVGKALGKPARQDEEKKAKG